MAKIAILGVGAMGSRMAKNLIDAGNQLVIYNRSPQRLANFKELGVEWASTPRQAAQGAGWVIAMVRDDKASEAVWLGKEGALHGLSPGSIAIDMSTLSPGWVKTLSRNLTASGADFLEAPVLGTLPQAEAGQLVVLAGGEAEVLEKAQPALQAISANVQHIGEIGQAAAMKLAVNTQYGTQVAIWAETLALLEKQGITKARAVSLLNSLPTTAPAMQVVGNLLAEQNYQPLFPIELVEKDFAYAEALADASGVDPHIIRGVRVLYKKAIAAGYGQQNIVGVAQLFSSQA